MEPPQHHWDRAEASPADPETFEFYQVQRRHLYPTTSLVLRTSYRVDGPDLLKTKPQGEAPPVCLIFPIGINNTACYPAKISFLSAVVSTLARVPHC